VKSVLFEPLKFGALTLSNRIIMAPLTRARAVGEGRVPNDLMVEYYSQRASAGLILTEATCIDPLSVGYANTPGIWSPEQVQGWKRLQMQFTPKVENLLSIMACGKNFTFDVFRWKNSSSSFCDSG